MRKSVPRGFIRPTKKWPADMQREKLLEYGVAERHIYEDWELLIKQSRPSPPTEIVVASFMVLGDTLREIIRRGADANRKEVAIKDLETGEIIASGAFVSLDLAARNLQGQASFASGPSPAERGAMGGRPEKPAQMSEREMLMIWRDPSLTAAQAAEQIGWSLAKCYRVLKKREVGMGRPTTDK